MRACRRAVHGVLVLDKPLGGTSHTVLQQVKRLFMARKAGHTGSLDPMASGVLPLFFGQVTRLAQFLLDADKSYDCTVVFGTNSTTGDVEGDYVRCCDTGDLKRSDIEVALPELCGPIVQYPPAFSAVKVGGQPLYRSARRGIYVNRPPRRVVIHSARIKDFFPGCAARAEISISCTKGTYIRSWVADLGRILGCGAYVLQLRRTRVGCYTMSQATNMEALEEIAHTGGYGALDALLLPPRSPVAHFPEVRVTRAEVYKLRCGQKVSHDMAERDMVRIVSEAGDLIGIGRSGGVKTLVPHIILNFDSCERVGAGK